MIWRRYQERAYARLKAEQPAWFMNAVANGVDILFDKNLAKSAKANMASSIPSSAPKEWKDVGVLYEDSFFTLIKDAVRFPDRSLGTYIRLMLSKSSGRGVAVLPFLGEKVVLVRQYRHATRCFHLAIPRGFGKPGEDPAATAEREVLEEIGGRIASIEAIGSIHPDTGILGYDVALFRASISGDLVAEQAEAIESIVALTPEEFCARIASGEISDSFTLCAFAKIAVRGEL